MIVGCIVLACVFIIFSLFLLFYLARKQDKRKKQIDEMLKDYNNDKIRENNKNDHKEPKREDSETEQDYLNLLTNPYTQKFLSTQNVKKSNNSSDDKQFKSGFILAGHFISAFTIIGFIILLILGVNIITVLILLFSDIFIICLTYGLGTALTKINRIENILFNKDIINQDDIKEINDYIIPDNVYICKKCGYQLFPEDNTCPNCKTPKEKD